jgi:hypothetical protein
MAIERKVKRTAEDYAEELKRLIRRGFPDAEFEFYRRAPKEYDLDVYGDFDDMIAVERLISDRHRYSAGSASTFMSCRSDAGRIRLVIAEEPIARVMHEMPYGLTSSARKNPMRQVNGMMADWVMQVSFQPRLSPLLSRMTPTRLAT